MKNKFCGIITLIILNSLFSCNSSTPGNSNKETIMINQKDLKNEKVRSYALLECMYQDPYFPKFLVDKCKNILLELCSNIERENPKSLEELYVLSHSATEKINDLQGDFSDNGSEIETGARECLAVDFEFISQSYGFEADIEELIAPRDW